MVVQMSRSLLAVLQGRPQEVESDLASAAGCLAGADEQVPFGGGCLQKVESPGIYCVGMPGWLVGLCLIEHAYVLLPSSDLLEQLKVQK